MKGILFLAHRLPFPPDRGDKIRSHNVLKALAGLGPVHVGCLADGDAELAAAHELEALCASWCMPRRSKSLPLAGVEALARRVPVSLAAFRHGRLAAYVERLLRSGEVDAVYVFSGQMGQYVPAWWNGRLVVDLVDVDSAKFAAYAADGRTPMGWVHAREARLLAAEEARLAARADQVLLVSEPEADLLRSRLPAQHRARVRALGNGIDAARFDPARIAPADLGQGPHVVFTGQMDYPPNVEAALRAVFGIMPLVRARFPQAMFHVVGRAPVPQVAGLDGVAGCRVWGEVPDVRPFLAAADVVLAPLRIARGVQNKVLEGMAMARPVVLSAEAATGIPGRAGEHFSPGETDAELADAVIACLADPAAALRQGAQARALVMRELGWEGALAPLAQILGREDVRARDAA